MLVGDLIYNDDFDVNCNVHVWKCTPETCWGESGSELIWSTEQNGSNKPLDALLDKEVRYMTIDAENMAIVIEVY